MFYQRTRRQFIVALVTLTLTIISCSLSIPSTTPQPTASGTNPSGSPQAPTETAKPTGPKIVTFVFNGTIDTLNPLYSKRWFSSITHQIWNCWAWDYDSQNKPRPVLVKEIPSTQNGGISADNKVITLKLREDITWSDGTPITAQDFAFTYQMANDIQNMSILPYPYNKISQLDTPDDHTVVMTFSEPFIAWEATLWHGLLPAHILKPVYEQEQTLDAAAWNLAPTVGCGPFVFTEWVENDHVRFVRNENYWLGKPNIDEIYIRFAADDAAQKEALLNGQGDLGTFIAFSDAPSLESAGLKIASAFSGYNEGWIFYLNPYYGHPALLDIRVRQAIAMALDRFTLNRDLLHGLTQPAVSYWDNTPYIDPSISAWPYDPEKAKQLLDEAGWVDSNGDGVRDQDGVDIGVVMT